MLSTTKKLGHACMLCYSLAAKVSDDVNVVQRLPNSSNTNVYTAKGILGHHANQRIQVTNIYSSSVLSIDDLTHDYTSMAM